MDDRNGRWYDLHSERSDDGALQQGCRLRAVVARTSLGWHPWQEGGGTGHRRHGHHRPTEAVDRWASSGTARENHFKARTYSLMEQIQGFDWSGLPGASTPKAYFNVQLITICAVVKSKCAM